MPINAFKEKDAKSDIVATLLHNFDSAIATLVQEQTKMIWKGLTTKAIKKLVNDGLIRKDFKLVFEFVVGVGIEIQVDETDQIFFRVGPVLGAKCTTPGK